MSDILSCSKDFEYLEWGRCISQLWNIIEGEILYRASFHPNE